MDNKVFTNVDVRRINNAGKLKANGKVLVAGVVEVKFRVMEGANGLFAALPSTKGKDDKYYNDVYLPDEATRKLFQEVVLAAYNNSSEATTSKTSKSKPLPF